MAGLRKIFVFALFLSLFFWAVRADSSPAKPGLKISRISIPFIENRGQVNKEVAFYAHTFGGTVFVTRKGEIFYSLPKIEKGRKQTKRAVLVESLLGAKVLEVKGVEPSETKINYFIGKNPRKWKRNIPSYRSVSLGEVYPGVELLLKARGKNVEKVFKILPKGRVSSIRLRMEGGKSIRISEDGTLDVETPYGSVSFTKPLAYQEIDGRRRGVEVKYVLFGKNEYGFYVSGKYDSTKPLIIDPLLASTFLGGSDWDEAWTLSIARDGSVYVAGSTKSDNFPTTVGVYDSSYGGADEFFGDVFISRLSSDLSRLLASTFLGGRAGEVALALSVAPDGSVFAAGWTYSNDFPTTEGAYDRSFGGGRDAFISRLSGDLSQLLASTFLGGSDEEGAMALSIAPDGSVFAAGWTYSNDFPTTEGAYDRSFGGWDDAFISHLSGDLSQLLASTLLGGSNNRDAAYALSIAPDGSVYVAGYTGSNDFPTTEGAYDNFFGGGGKPQDAFISHLSNNLSQLLASTFLGGRADEVAWALSVAPDGSVYVAGNTESSNFPTTEGAYDRSFGGGYWGDAFISRLSGDLSRLLASTFLGGSDSDYANTLSIATDGSVYVAGWTHSSDFPATEGAYNVAPAFISRLSSDLSQLLISTFLGGSEWDVANALSVAPDGSVYLAGATASNDFPATEEAYQSEYKGGEWDAFIARLDLGGQVPSDRYSLTITKSGSGSGRVTSSPAGIDCGSTCSAQFDSGTSVTLTSEPDDKSVFSGWGGDCNACGRKKECTLTVDGNKVCTATFAEITTQVFNDVPPSHWAFRFINAIFQAGITAGCGGGNYCPDMHVTRAQMAVFILKSLGISPASRCTGRVFADVNVSTVGEGFCKYIEKFAELGITSGCQADDPDTPENEARFCPEDKITRAQMAVFMVRALGKQPASVCSGQIFTDVDASTVGEGFCKYIEEFYRLGITSGCGNNRYCPDNYVPRDQMAVFLTRGFLN